MERQRRGFKSVKEKMIKKKKSNFTPTVEGDFVPKKIHFMGIGGSACSGVALMAKSRGFDVSGCDIDGDTSYIRKVKKAGIQVFEGHAVDHIKNIDILSISPAIEYQNNNHPEYLEAKKLGIVEIWDKFVGKYLLKDKESICITGTHGKSTTTSLAAIIFEEAGFDPSALIGAKVTKWDSTYRIGGGKYFIIEADDFYGKFLSYHPSTIVINNIEFDHPDFFKSERDMVDLYSKFVKLLNGSKNLIINQDSECNKQLIELLGRNFLTKVNLLGYTFESKPRLKLNNSVKISVEKVDELGTTFSLKSSNLLHFNNIYYLSIPGKFNVANAAGVVILAKLYGISDDIVRKTLKEFNGIGRRLELIGESKGIKVYDDYAHHPTAIQATINALRQKYPTNRIWAVNEPHSYSRTKALLNEYAGVFDEADKVIIAPIFKARDKETFGINENILIKSTNHRDIQYIDNFPEIAGNLTANVSSGDIILVMGAGKSYLLARDILKNL